MKITPRMLAALAALAGPVGCDKDQPDLLRPEGPPEILQMFVIDGDGVSRLAFGDHCEISGVSPFGDDCGLADDQVPIHADQAGPVNAALVEGQRIRIVFDELLEPATVEQFVCACAAGGCPTRGHTFPPGTEVDPTRCTSCEDDPTTPDVNETGQCSDVNFDGVPDDALLQPNIVALDCGGTAIEIGEDDGFYNPSGNQLIPVLGGTDALGPALVVNPSALPTDADCTVTVASTVTDKDGMSPTADGPLTFHTEPLAVVGTDPQDGATDVAIEGFTLSVFFSEPVDSGTGIEVSAGAAAVAGTVELSSTDPTVLEWTPAAPLAPATTFAVTVTTGVTDQFGSPLPAAFQFSFTTAGG